MRTPVFTMVALAAIAGATTVSAQARPDFSGQWTRVADTTEARSSVAATGDASFRRGDMGSGWGTTLTIEQTTDLLTVRYTFFSTYDLQPPLRFAYALDGSESRNAIMIGHTSSTQRSQAKWEGNTLVITTRHAVPSTDGQVVEERRALSLESPSLLVVHVTRGPALGGTSSITSVRYAKR